jgi:Cu-Zn family superoxide dismutase
MKRNLVKIALVIVAFAFGNLAVLEETQAQEKAKVEDHKVHSNHMIGKAVAVLYPTQNNTAQGVVTFTKEDGGVRVVAKLTGVPKGVHGFHIHEFGDCSSPDGSAAGGHFNPTGTAHAGPAAEKRHMGDLGNITADDQGNASLDYVDKHLAMSGANAILGHAVILHANPDDFTTQPTGNAGGRIACGVIGVAKP